MKKVIYEEDVINAFREAAMKTGVLMTPEDIIKSVSDIFEKKYDTIDYEGVVNNHIKSLMEAEQNNPEHISLVVNAYGGPGAGKTTACFHVVEELKKRGFVAEYVAEYAKELVWDGRMDILDGKHQFNILQEQLHRVDRLVGKVDFIVTDSPILLNAVYNKELTKEYNLMIKDLNEQYNNFNFIVKRDSSKFEKEGRIHTLSESIEKDKEIIALLDKYKLYYGLYTHDKLSCIVEDCIKTHESLVNKPLKKNLNPDKRRG